MKKFFAGMLMVLLAACSQTEALQLAPQAAPAIRVSKSTSGTPYVALAGTTQSGKIYVYAPYYRPSSSVKLRSVTWVRDGKGIHTDKVAPYTLTYNGGLADTTRWGDGQHTVTARYNFSNGKRERVSATFTVRNTAVQEPTPTPEPTRNLLFADEFEGSTLNLAKWSSGYPWNCRDGYNYNCSTGEVQVYRPENVRVENGNLVINAKRESYGGKNYTSGLVQTYGKFDHQYGYVEARIKQAPGAGTWGAFWNHSSLDYGSKWPPEIDFMEHLGRDPNRIPMHLHTELNGHTDHGYSWLSPVDMTQGFHVYGVEWKAATATEKASVTWYIDGVQRARYEGADVPAEKMYLILNVAVGGSWAGTPSTTLNSNMYVDYVRVYDRK